MYYNVFCEYKDFYNVFGGTYMYCLVALKDNKMHLITHKGIMFGSAL